METSSQVDVVLVGAGIMSATLGVLLKELDPSLSIQIFESLEMVAEESSNAWNNAGTGHAALCELNYTPQLADGTVQIAKALEINEWFELSKQLWSYMVEIGVIEDVSTFLHQVPHLSFVTGEKDCDFLKKRWEGLKAHPGFAGMEFSQDHSELAEWMPLIMDGRNPAQKVAGTRVGIGTDVDFGALTRIFISHLKNQPDVSVFLRHEVTDIEPSAHTAWRVHVKDKVGNGSRIVGARFVFLGAGGGAFPLLQKSGIPEGKGFGGFPVSGQWLRCDNPEIVQQHHAKVYGKAAVGAPPMSVPHLDTRVIGGKRSLLFGPYAGFTTRYLKHGSLLDFPTSARPDNLVPMIAAGLQNVPLTRYLIEQVLQSEEKRFAALAEFFPKAKMDDWDLQHAGQRVQIIKKDAKKGGILQFGTEVVSSEDGSLAALLGASPGASTSVHIMMDLIEKCFPYKLRPEGWQTKLEQMIPSYRNALATDPEWSAKQKARTNEILGLEAKEASVR